MNLTATRCSCGAITVDGEDFSNSMRRETFKKEFPGVPVGRKRVYSSCNHCVNHWGLDVCGCGSGQPVGKCDGEHAECRNKQASQVKGEAKESAVSAMLKRGGFA